ncbi:MAG TPA: S8 family serine peptidase, partial [Ferruginibacter sp.]|nr:S8 family serine peptidase [Ferruginibacter sp.]
MKKFYSLLLFTLFVFSYITITAQNTDMPVRFAAGNFITGNNIQRQNFQIQDLQNSLFNNDYYVLVQFATLPSPQSAAALRNAGLQLGTWFPGNAYFSSMNKSFDLSLAAKYNIVSINHLPAFYKIDPALPNKGTDDLFAVSYYPSLNKADVVDELQKAGAVVLTTKYTATNVVFIQSSNNIINAIAALPFVSSISLQSMTDKPLNYKSIGKHAVTSLLSPSGRNLSGKGITVGVGDNSEILTPHVDFTGRVIGRVWFPFSFHGIHVSGTVAGGGILDPKNNGMAPRATIVSQWFSDIITNTPTYYADHNMIVTNNSYTTANDSCAGNSKYDVVSNYADNQMRDYEKVLHVFSAGNDGRTTCSPFPISFATIKTGYQCAKNVLTVGAIDSFYLIADFSSRGPVQDGRIKPEIVATGVNVFSTRQNNTYG